MTEVEEKCNSSSCRGTKSPGQITAPPTDLGEDKSMPPISTSGSVVSLRSRPHSLTKDKFGE